jgi:hypothetical protein
MSTAGAKGVLRRDEAAFMKPSEKLAEHVGSLVG